MYVWYIQPYLHALRVMSVRACLPYTARMQLREFGWLPHGAEGHDNIAGRDTVVGWTGRTER